MLRLFLIITLVIALIGCNKRPEGILSEEEMTDLLVDIELADVYYNTNAGAAHIDRKTLVEAVLQKHGVKKETLDSTLSYYGRNIDDYYALYDGVEKKLRKQDQGVQETVEENDIWPYSRFTAFMPDQMSDALTFSMPGEEISPGNSLDWRMRLSSPEGVEIMLGVEYDNGITTIAKKNAAGNRSPNVSLLTDTALIAKRIFGFVSVPESAKPVWVDSIRLMTMEFDSVEYQKIRYQKMLYKPSPRPLAKDTVETAE